MHAPLRLDIGWSDLAFAARALLSARGPGQRADEIEAFWAPGEGLACLSVRSGFDLYLEALALPAGSEVLVTAFTIPDMVRILRHHGLVPVPVDLELDTLAPSRASLEAAVTPRTQAILYAHLFGSRDAAGPALAVAAEQGLRFWEDCAQAYVGDDYRGAPGADLAMFSFGTIKTATALGGGMLTVRDAGLRERMQRLRDDQPKQARSAFAKKVGRAALLKALGSPRGYGAFVRTCRMLGRDHADIIHRATRGFPGDLMAGIRKQPCAPLLAVLERRLKADHRARIARRTANGARLVERLGPGLRLPGREAPLHSHWVFAMLADDPDAWLTKLREAGFDATRSATATAALVSRADGMALENCGRLQDGLVYLSADPDMAEGEVERLAGLLAS